MKYKCHVSLPTSVTIILLFVTFNYRLLLPYYFICHISLPTSVTILLLLLFFFKKKKKEKKINDNEIYKEMNGTNFNENNKNYRYATN